MTTQRNIELPGPTPGAAAGGPGRKLIAAIGIDRYQHWQRLRNAVNDATRTAELFQQLGFEPAAPPLLEREATGRAIQALVSHDLKKLGPSDSLVVFFAGHGTTYGHRPGGEEIRAGYLIPVDGANSPDDVSTWIDLEIWLRAIALLPAKHILVILDACRTGIALDGIIQRARGLDMPDPEPLAALTARRSRRIITSALGDQVAFDTGPRHGHSLFTGCLIEALSYDLRRSGDRTTTGSSLGSYLQRRVDAHTASKQTPDFGYFLHDNRGELAIPLAAADLPPEPATAAHDSLELAPWTATSAAEASSSAARLVSSTPISALEAPSGSAASGPTAADAAPRKPRSVKRPAGQPGPTPLMSPYARRSRAESHANDQPEDDAARPDPLGAMELSDLIHRLESAVDMDGQGMTVFAVFALIVAAIALVFGVDTPSWFGLGLGTCAMLAALVAISWRVIVPLRMRRVIKAVRDTPDKITVLLHSSRNAWIEIRTTENLFVVQAKHDRASLFEALVRRCRSARVRHLP
jgi:uncharacterized caspase-like protein